MGRGAGQQWKKIDGKSKGGFRVHVFHKADYYMHHL